MTKIFVSAYACEPGLGSEIGVGWHWVLEMSKCFELWVLTRESNRHAIEPWIAEHPEYQTIHFLYYDWPDWARFWKKGLRGVRTYYNIWQACTNGIVRRTMRQNGIRVFHHLTYGNVLWKVSSYGQRQFFIWGPAGGVETVPEEFTRHYPKKSRLVEALRRAVAGSLGWNAGFQRRCRNAGLILCKTDILRQHIPEKHRNKAVLFTDVAVDTAFQAAKDSEPMAETPLPSAKDDATSDEKNRVEYLTVGRLDPWRGFDLCIGAVALAARERPCIHLSIIGKGPDRERLQNLVCSLGLEDRVSFIGAVPMEEYRERMRGCDVVLNASLKEGAVTVSFDSMACGKPLICVDTTGYTRYFSKEYAEVIEPAGRDETIRALARGMVRLADPGLRREMGIKAQKAGERFSWQCRGEEIRSTISEALKNQSRTEV